MGCSSPLSTEVNLFSYLRQCWEPLKPAAIEGCLKTSWNEDKLTAVSSHPGTPYSFVISWWQIYGKCTLSSHAVFFIDETTVLAEACAWLGGWKCSPVVAVTWPLSSRSFPLYECTKTAHHSVVSSGNCSFHGQLIVVLLKSLQMLLGSSQSWTLIQLP